VGMECLSLDSIGHFGGIITGWSQNLILTNSFFVLSCMCTEFFQMSFSMPLTLLNIYRPYDDKKPFMERIISSMHLGW
jgi:hypothetical protein